MGADPATHDAEQMASWIQRDELTVFTLRDAHRRFRKPSPQDLLPALDVLELRGYIRPTEVPKRNGPGRKPSPRYEVNPAALVGERTPGEHDIQPVAPLTRRPPANANQVTMTTPGGHRDRRPSDLSVVWVRYLGEGCRVIAQRKAIARATGMKPMTQIRRAAITETDSAEENPRQGGSLLPGRRSPRRALRNPSIRSYPLSPPEPNLYTFFPIRSLSSVEHPLHRQNFRLLRPPSTR